MKNSIILGNCFDEIKKIESESINLILIDPPYSISKSSNFNKVSDKSSHNIKTKYSKISIDFGDWDREDIDFDTLFSEYYRVLKKGGTLILFYDIWKSGSLKDLAFKHKFKQPRIGMWVKCISGSSEIYIRNLIGEHKKMTLKDIYRNNNFTNLQVWNGNCWVNIHDIVMSNNTDMNLKIELNSGEEIKSSRNHKFVLTDGKEVEASNLKIGDTLKSCNLPDSDFNNVEMMSENMAWFIGLYLAEGSMSNRKMQISSNINETYRIEKIKKLCKEYDGKFYIFRKENSNSMSINVSSGIIQSYLEKYLSGRLSYDKRFSNNFWNLPNKILEIIFFSYLDADAHFDSKNRRYKVGFTGKNRGLEKDIRTICSRLNYRCSMRIAKITNTKTGKKHSVIRGSIYVDRNSKERVNLFSIKKITELNREKTNYFDIILFDNVHLFSLYSGVLIHNCNPTPINSKTNYLSNASEYLFTFVKGKNPTFNSEYDNGIYRYPLCHGKERLNHPTQKPIKLICDLIKKHSNEGDTILDTFSGTGTTAEACYLTNRNFLCIEKNLEYYNLSVDRIKQYLNLIV